MPPLQAAQMAMQNGQRRLKLMQGVVNNSTAKRDRTDVTKTPSTQVTPENVKKGATSDDLQPRALDFSTTGLGFYGASCETEQLGTP